MIGLSVVVATYNRCDTLKVTLERLAVQTYPASRFEVIVVDDGSPDGTGPMVESLVSRVPYRLRYYSHSNRGPGASQNRGIQEAAGDLILLMADDIQPTPTMLERHVQCHERHPEACIAVLGRVLQSPELPRTVFLRNWDPFKFRKLRREMELPYWKFWACNISVSRSFLLEHGLYRERKGAAHEDVELGYRLSRRGLRIFYTPDALAHHYHIETLESACARAYERGLNWWFVEEHIPDPQIHVGYHVLTLHTLKYYYQTFRRLSESSLPIGDRILPWLLLKQAARAIVFNRVSVPYFWIPVLRQTETNPLLAALVNPYMARGAIFYHFAKGCRDSQGRGALLRGKVADAD